MASNRLLAPFFGEVLSVSSPPAAFFQPLTFLLLVGLYGCGALLVRELARHWKQGWVSIALLGMAYGIYEEGLVVRSFFDPTWMDLGILGVYGRWLGVNWIWSIALTLFHAVVSISLPIWAVETLFPSLRERRWLGKGGVIVCSLVFFAFLLLSPFFSSHFRIAGVLACVLCMAGLVWIAHRWRDLQDAQPEITPKKPYLVGLVCFVLMLGLIVGMYFLPALGLPAWMSFLLLAGLPWLGLLVARRKGSAR